jgi:hypothetical protein
MFIGDPSGRAGHDDVVTRLEDVSHNALLRQ